MNLQSQDSYELAATVQTHWQQLQDALRELERRGDTMRLINGKWIVLLKSGTHSAAQRGAPL